MTAQLIDNGPAINLPLEALITTDTRFNYGIPVNLFIDRFGVNNPGVMEVLKLHPPLVYMLGRVSGESSGTTDRLQPDKVSRPIYSLLEGSVMFGLENPDDARRWPGIFGHGLGTARQAWFVFNLFKQLNPQQRAAFEQAGFSFEECDDLEPGVVRDFMMIDHLSRRIWDERRSDGVNITGLSGESPGEMARNLLFKYKAPVEFLNLIRIEDHVHQLAERAIDGEEGSKYFPFIVDAILTYVDWTFERSPIELKSRFARLREYRKDIAGEILKTLESCGTTFESTVNSILGIDLFAELKNIPPYAWEYRIRQAYCAPSGVKMQEVFPEYFAQYPQ